MNCKKLLACVLLAAVGLAAVVGSMAIAQSSDDAAKAALAEIKLPEGWTQEDLQACILAGTPGKVHEQLAQIVGEWTGKCTMWMTPDAEPMTSECTATVTAIMDGRYIKAEMKGDMPGMGPYESIGIYGYDNVSQKLVASWIDNHSTGIMSCEGEMSPAEKKITYNYTFNCPLTKKPAHLREVEVITGPKTKTLETFGPDSKTGKVYKMCHFELTKK